MAGKAKTGRGSKFTPEVCERLIEAARAGLMHGDCCDEAGISTPTLYAWLSEGERFASGLKHDFSVNFREAEKHTMRTAIKTITIKIETDWRAAAWYLERKKPGDWSRNVTMTGPNGGPLRHAGPDGEGPILLEVTGPGGGPVRLAIDLSNATEAQLDALEAIARQTIAARKDRSDESESGNGA
jgi:hypothetical protein